MKLSNAELRVLWLACQLAEERMLRASRKAIEDVMVENYSARAREFHALIDKLENELDERDGDGPLPNHIVRG